METYNENIKCSNCGEVEKVDIPKGESKLTFSIGKSCKRCGCREMKPYIETTKNRIDKESY